MSQTLDPTRDREIQRSSVQPRTWGWVNLYFLKDGASTRGCHVYASEDLALHGAGEFTRMWRETPGLHAICTCRDGERRVPFHEFSHCIQIPLREGFA